jgi:hypothetical protein
MMDSLDEAEAALRAAWERGGNVGRFLPGDIRTAEIVVKGVRAAHTDRSRVPNGREPTSHFV